MILKYNKITLLTSRLWSFWVKIDPYNPSFSHEATSWLDVSYGPAPLTEQNMIEGSDGSSCKRLYFSKINFEMKKLDLIKLVEISSKNFNNEKIFGNENIWKKITKEFIGYYCYT
ncbi:hypothetical protein BpHYR1_040993 [Brachionus plicatilis]|uniref:Uncharacterized protein n=1 Tax=Brachionus plicatilis TaxID=10195 RepID=A0A3M7QQG1_BRAPC|nr:hypothetical protein BpHYR1_040993 [Brachionus plicatilis]